VAGTRGSLFETVTLLEIFRRRDWIGNLEFVEFRRSAIHLGKRISALLNAVRRSSK
jgi:hypothetical protein